MTRPVSTLDLLPTDIETDLRATVRGLLADRCDHTAVTALYDGDRSVVTPLWKALTVELGLAELLVPEKQGGAGASAREAAAVLEELGRAVAPTPFLTSAVIATTALLDSESGILDELAAGRRTAALLVPLSTPPDAPLATVTVDADGRLSGAVTSVAGALEADLLLVLAETADGLAMYAVDADRVTVQPVVSLDMTRQLADVRLAGVPAERVLDRAEPAVRRALMTGAALLASEQVGVARWCLEETVSYLKVRKQFGRVLGSYQALKHRLADLYADVESASAAAVYAVAAIAAGDPDAAMASHLAQAYCSDLAVHAAEEAIQLHGGIGMTWEHPAHLYLKKAKADQIALGTPGMHRARLAALIDLEA